MNRRSVWTGAAVLVVLSLAGPARAAEFTEVVDAFDGDDPFDLQLSIGYSRTLSMGNITRECNPGDTDSPRHAYCPVVGEGDFLTTVDVLRYVHVRHILDIEVLIGLYHDLQLKLGLPIILHDERQLVLADKVSQTAADAILDDPTYTGVLFDTPFRSPNRSGIDQFVVGFEWAPFNQERDETKPTWTLFVEGWFAVGKIIQAGGSYKDGADWTDVGATGKKAGISPGVHELRVGTKISRRFKYLDPYFGFLAVIPFPKKGESPWPYMEEYTGQSNVRPPIWGRMTFGSEIIPWEAPAKNQKFYIDLRITAEYHSEGKSITPLFDALGSSSQEGLDFCDPAHPEGLGSSFCGAGGAFPDYQWTGLTDTENYASFGARLALGFVTSKWFKLEAGVSLYHDQEHFLTFADECNPNEVKYDDVTGEVVNCDWNPGSMSDNAAFNPDYRRAIDSVGNRFRVEESTIFNFFVNATAMF